MIDPNDFPIQVDEEIRLELTESEHSEMLFRLVEENRKHLQEWLLWVSGWTHEHQRKEIQQGLHNFDEGKSVPLNIRHQGKLVGRVAIHSIDPTYETAEFAYWLAKDATGKGIAIRSCEALIRYAFETLGLHRIEIRCALGNTKSSAIPKRLRFRHEGTLREAILLHGERHDQEVYGLLQPDWAKNATK